MKSLVFVSLALITFLACASKTEKAAPSSAACPYHGAVRASDGKAGFACKADVVMKVGELSVPVASLETTTGTSFHGSAGAITQGPVGVPLRMVVKCEGYDVSEKELNWTLVPSECKDLDAGEFLVSPSKR
jgi:hypothetical protein